MSQKLVNSALYPESRRRRAIAGTSGNRGWPMRQERNFILFIAPVLGLYLQDIEFLRQQHTSRSIDLFDLRQSPDV